MNNIINKKTISWGDVGRFLLCVLFFGLFVLLFVALAETKVIVEKGEHGLEIPSYNIVISMMPMMLIFGHLFLWAGAFCLSALIKGGFDKLNPFCWLIPFISFILMMIASAGVSSGFPIIGAIAVVLSVGSIVTALVLEFTASKKPE